MDHISYVQLIETPVPAVLSGPTEENELANPPASPHFSFMTPIQKDEKVL